MPEYKDIRTRLRENTKRTDLPSGVVPLIAEAYGEIERLNERVRDLETRIGNASITLADWDGFYDPNTEKGNARELASLIEEGYTILQGKSWND